MPTATPKPPQPVQVFPNGLTGEQWRQKLEEIAGHLQSPAALCLIGAAAGMFAEQQRTSIDLDVFRRASRFVASDLKQACEKAGVIFNPTDEYLPPGVPYVQIVEEGIVQVGQFDRQDRLMGEGKLTVSRPPIENIIASKLCRSARKDLDDIGFLCQKFPVSKKKVMAAIKTFSDPSRRDSTMENAVYLDAYLPFDRAALRQECSSAARTTRGPDL